VKCGVMRYIVPINYFNGLRENKDSLLGHKKFEENNDDE
jgi:hypothetical protein